MYDGPLIDVVIPTVTGREAHYARCLAAYVESTVPLHIVTIKDAHTCAEAWIEGAAQGTADWLHFTADDLEPVKGWDTAAMEIVGKVLPAPVLLNADGSVWSPDEAPGMEVAFPRVPLIPRTLWETMGETMPPLHYWSDVWIGAKALEQGYTFKVIDGYRFTHYWASEGRIHDDAPDYDLYRRSL